MMDGQKRSDILHGCKGVEKACLVLVGAVEFEGDATKAGNILRRECNVSKLADEVNVAAARFLDKAANAKDLQECMEDNYKYWAFGLTMLSMVV